MLHPGRIGRYRPAAGNSTELAFRLYLWNCALCEAFYLSIHFSEIVCRNALNSALIRRCGERWFEDPTLKSILDRDFRRELEGAVGKENKQHATLMTARHVVSALSFGFWEHLATKRFDRFLWARGTREIFPCAPKSKNREDVRLLIESVRRWRNRIAHHQAIFDKSPMKKHNEALELIKWACEETGAWVSSVSRVPVAISLRPR
jgi:hypothetical protein